MPIPPTGQCLPKAAPPPNFFYFMVPEGCPECTVSYGRNAVTAQPGYVIVVDVVGNDVSTLSLADFTATYNVS